LFFRILVRDFDTKKALVVPANTRHKRFSSFSDTIVTQQCKLISRFHVPFWLSHILVYYFTYILITSFCPSYDS